MAALSRMRAHLWVQCRCESVQSRDIPTTASKRLTPKKTRTNRSGPIIETSKRITFAPWDITWDGGPQVVVFACSVFVFRCVEIEVSVNCNSDADGGSIS